VRPDFVFVEVLPPLFYQTGGKTIEENWLQGEWFRLDEVRGLAARHSNPSRPLREWAWSRLFSTVLVSGPMRRQLALERSGAGAAEPDAHGWYRAVPSRLQPGQVRHRTQTAHEQYEKSFHDFRLADGPAGALADILAICRREGIPAALLLMP